ncbi:hypothetical protein BaRGS_00028792 [Batillaria attramentaria]|uniref:Uncharacterized protein n=1 Tax=Batillaria attramentaria TaxID=370345 RepID=A0ABD0JZG1_9CAEN
MGDTSTSTSTASSWTAGCYSEKTVLELSTGELWEGVRDGVQTMKSCCGQPTLHAKRKQWIVMDSLLFGKGGFRTVHKECWEGARRCTDHEIWLWAAHTQGKEKIVVDQA